MREVVVNVVKALYICVFVCKVVVNYFSLILRKIVV